MAQGDLEDRLKTAWHARAGTRIAILAALYALAAKAAPLMAFVDSSATPVWAPTGIALAALLLYGYGLWPGIALGALLANLLTAGSVATSLGIATGNTLEALAGAWLVTRFANGRRFYERPGDFLRFVALASILSTAVSPSCGISSLCLGGYSDWEDFGKIWLPWWLSDMMGSLLVTPLLLLWAARRRTSWTLRRAVETVLLLAGAGLLGQLAFGGWISEDWSYPLVFLCFPMLSLAAFRFGASETAAATLMLSAVAITHTLHGHGALLLGSNNASLLLLQAFLGIQGTTALVIASVVEARRLSDVALQEVHSRLELEMQRRLVLDAALDAVITIDAAGMVIDWNPQAERTFGWSLQEILGKPVAEFIIPPDQREAHLLGMKRFAATGQGPVINKRIERIARRKDGTDFPAEMTIIPVRTEGTILFSAFIRDITERNLSQEKLQLHTDIIRNIQVGFCVCRLEDDGSLRLVAMNPAAAEMTRLAPESLQEKRLDEILPALRALGVTDVLARVALSRAPSDLIEIFHRDERIPEQYWSYKAFPMPGRCVGVAFEGIGKRKKSEIELKRANALLVEQTQKLALRSKEMSLLIDLSGVLSVALSREEVYGILAKFAGQLLPEESGALHIRDDNRRLVRAVSTWGAVPPARGEFPFDDCWALRRGHLHRMDDARTDVPCRHLASPLPAGSLCIPMMAWGETLGVLHCFNETRKLTEVQEHLLNIMTEQAALALANLRLQEKLRQQANLDVLTGLFNRRYMDKEVAREVSRAVAKSSPLCLAILDLDHFKRLNDSNGHPAGDALLQQIGALLKRRVKNRDIACRYGGEEFTILFPDTPFLDALHRIQDLQKEIRELRVNHNGNILESPSVSIGVAIVPEHGRTPEEIIAAADAALYRAKTGGRDRIVVATGVKAPTGM